MGRQMGNRVVVFHRKGYSVLLCSMGILLLLCSCTKGVTGKKAFPNRLGADLGAAHAALQRGDFPEAISLCGHILKEDPENGQAFYCLGLSYGQKGEHGKEVYYYEKALSAGFRNDTVLFNLGMAYGETGKMGKAVGALKEAVAMAPHRAENYFGLGLVYQGSVQDALAEKAFLKALEIKPDYLEARLFLGLLYADAGDFPRARSQMDHVLAMNPGHPLAREFLETILKE